LFRLSWQTVERVIMRVTSAPSRPTSSAGKRRAAASQNATPSVPVNAEFTIRL
jgi:hypothetical protein